MSLLRQLKAGDEQWLGWIKQADIGQEKRWSQIFAITAIVCAVLFVTGLIMRSQLGPAFGIAVPFFFLMAMAKYNNYRLYRIIQSQV